MLCDARGVREADALRGDIRIELQALRLGRRCRPAQPFVTGAARRGRDAAGSGCGETGGLKSVRLARAGGEPQGVAAVGGHVEVPVDAELGGHGVQVAEGALHGVVFEQALRAHHRDQALAALTA